MSEVLYNAEREKIIDSLQNWIELREIRNELEHDYPDKLRKALEDLKFCVNSFDLLETYYSNSLDFAKRYINEII
jgi:L-lactate utilization protein LutB